MFRYQSVVQQLLQAAFVFLCGISSLTMAAVLDISLITPTPSGQEVPPHFKIDDEVSFRLTNNAPRDMTVATITAQGGDVLANDCEKTLEKQEFCDFKVKVTKFGMLQAIATSEKGFYKGASLQYEVTFRLATYNLSFDRPSFEELVSETGIERERQDYLVEAFRDDDPALTPTEKEQAKKVIQIRNVAEVIQRTRPDAFVLAEFDNNGTATDDTAINNFKTNYLAFAQSDDVTVIDYTYTKNFATNTGKKSGFDLNRDGVPDNGPDDAWGYGVYHGQYAFAVFSKYPFDEDNIRTFQNFKWKDMPGEVNIIIDDCDKLIPNGLKCGDSWYEPEAWDKFPLSSKNHVDLPVKLPDNFIVHFLVSHPAPPISDNAARHNTKRNRAEVDFWNDYIAGKSYFYDDTGKEGGLTKGEAFVVAGDLNADPDYGDGILEPIKNLLNNPQVNTVATVGAKAPRSDGAEYYLLHSGDCYKFCDRSINNDKITAVSSLRLDYVIPSKNMMVFSSGVFWPTPGEPGYHLVFDEDLGTSKGVSSDHRLVWIDMLPK